MVLSRKHQILIYDDDISMLVGNINFSFFLNRPLLPYGVEGFLLVNL
jgi:hypothetical protein